MTDELKPGDHVSWNTSQGRTRGEVKEKLTGEKKIKGHVAKATPEEPQYLVESEKSGEEAAHKPESLNKLKK